MLRCNFERGSFLRFLRFLHPVLSIFQTARSSYRRHGACCSARGIVQREQRGVVQALRECRYDSSENRISLLLSRFSHRNICVDIGSGNGWFSAYLAQFFSRIEAIEPSIEAQAIAKKIFPEKECSNVFLHTGLAEDILPSLLEKHQEPVLFITGCVLSHLRDKEVEKICQVLNTLSVRGSAPSFAECWGKPFRQYMWYSRSQEWWSERLSNWDLDFHGEELEGFPGTHKGFHGIKRA